MSMRTRARSWRASSTASATNRGPTVATAVRFLPLIPTETSLILKYLVDHLLKHKLHKTQLFMLEGKASETKSLLKCIRQGDLPSRLSSYSSRSISFVVRHLLVECYAPLLPYDRFPNLVESLECWSVRLLMDAMAPERRGLLESILLLLYKLALNSGGGSQSESGAKPGEALGAVLARPSEEELVETVVIRQRISAFLIENAPVLLRKQDEVRMESRGSAVALERSRFEDKDEGSAYGDLKNQARRRSSDDESDSEDSAGALRYEQDHDHPAYPSPHVSPSRQSFEQPLSIADQLPKWRRSSLSNSAMLSMGPLCSFSPELRSPTRTQPPDAPRTPVYQAAHHALSTADMTMLQRLLTVIVESPQDKQGLFIERPRRDDESKVLAKLLQLNVGKNLSFLPLESFSVLTLALFVKEFLLKSQMESLLGSEALEGLMRASLEGKEEVAIRSMLQSILETELNEPRRELVMLLLECVRLALVSGSEEHELKDVVARCLLGGCAQDQGATYLYPGVCVWLCCRIQTIFNIVVYTTTAGDQANSSAWRSIKAALYRETQRRLRADRATAGSSDTCETDTLEKAANSLRKISAPAPTTMSPSTRTSLSLSSVSMAVYWATKCLSKAQRRGLHECIELLASGLSLVARGCQVALSVEWLM